MKKEKKETKFLIQIFFLAIVLFLNSNIPDQRKC